MYKIIVCSKYMSSEVSNLLLKLRSQNKKYKIYKLKSINLENHEIFGANRLNSKDDLVRQICDSFTLDDKVIIASQSNDKELYDKLVKQLRNKAYINNNNGNLETWNIGTVKEESNVISLG